MNNADSVLKIQYDAEGHVQQELVDMTEVERVVLGKDLCTFYFRSGRSAEFSGEVAKEIFEEIQLELSLQKTKASIK